jgi:hypothetical protein
MASKRKTDAELLDALAAEAELARIGALSKSEVKDELHAAGFDSDAVGKRGAELAQKLLAKRAGAAGGWKDAARATRDAMRAQVGAFPAFGAMARSELLALVQAARTDPRYGAVIASFHKRGDEEATDEELRDLLAQIEAVRRLGDGGGA